MDTKFKVVSLNCRGLNNPIKAKRISTMTHKLRPHILMLQETHLRRPGNSVLKSAWWAQQLHAPGSSKARGVAILLSKSSFFRLIDTVVDPQGRFLFVKGYLADHKITLANVYVPNVGQLDFLQCVLKQLEAFKEGDMVLGGDFNLILDATKDKSRFKSGKMNTKKAKATTGCDILLKGASKFALLLENHELIDIWRM